MKACWPPPLRALRGVALLILSLVAALGALPFVAALGALPLVAALGAMSALVALLVALLLALWC